MQNTEKQWTEELHRRTDEAKKKAFDDEIKRIEKDVTLQAYSLIQKYFTEQESSLNETLQRARDEQQITLEKLQQKKGEVLHQLAVERRRKEDARKKAEEERKRQEEMERRRKEEEEKKRRQQEEKERKEKIRLAIETIRSLHTNGELDAALSEVEKALEVEPANEDLKIWEHRITEAKQKKIREEEVALAREKEKAQEERKRKSKVIRNVAMAAIGVVLIFIIYQFQKSIFPQTLYLAVEPFSFSGQAQGEPSLGSSIAREVAGKLSSFPNVTVMGFTSSLNIDKTRSNPEGSLNALGFTYILKGTLLRNGASYSADVTIVDSANSEVWSGHFEQPASSLMQLSEEIALQLATVMEVSVDSRIEKEIKRSGTSNSAAYLQYLGGAEYLDERTPESIQQAYNLFLQASSSDRSYADAYAGAASALLTKIEKRWDTSDSTYSRADQLIQQALKSKANLPAANIAQARLASARRKYNDAVNILDGVLQQYPRNVSALLHKADATMHTGNYDEAVSLLKRAYEISPREIDVLHLLAYADGIKGNHRDAMRYMEHILPLIADSTNYLEVSVIDIVMADPDLQVDVGKRIIAACERRLRENPRDVKLLYHLAQILQVLGKIPEANPPLLTIRNILQNQLIYSPRNAGAMMDLALALTRLGSFPEGLDMGRRAISLGRKDPTILYKLAQMYSIQMSSHRGGAIDTTKKNEALKYLREATALDFRVEELLDGDFYNLRTQPEFLTTIQQQSK